METLPLKDIHLPSPVGWWPLAPGWYLLFLLLLLMGCLVFFILRRHKQLSVSRSALDLLRAIRSRPDTEPTQVLIELSSLLRRVAITIAPRSDAASLTGSAWLAHLDRPFKDQPFSQGIGRCLANDPYRQTPSEDINVDALCKLCERWVKLQRPVKPAFFLRKREKTVKND
jgi:hypothetical protein